MAPSALVCPPLGNLCQLITPLQLIHVSGCGLSLTIEALSGKSKKASNLSEIIIEIAFYYLLNDAPILITI